MPFEPHRLMSEEHSLLSIRNRVGKGGGVQIPRSSLCYLKGREGDDSRRKDQEKPVTFHMCVFACTYTHVCTPMFCFVLLVFVLFQQQKNLKAQLPPTEGLFLPHLPMQAVWCWVKPGGHLHAKLPMVLTHRNWQLCCLVAHSSRSTRKCKTGIGVKHTAQAPRSCPRKKL